MRISDWSSDVCSSDLGTGIRLYRGVIVTGSPPYALVIFTDTFRRRDHSAGPAYDARSVSGTIGLLVHAAHGEVDGTQAALAGVGQVRQNANRIRSEEHTSELQSLMRISYAVFCLKKKIT